VGRRPTNPPIFILSVGETHAHAIALLRLNSLISNQSDDDIISPMSEEEITPNLEEPLEPLPKDSADEHPENTITFKRSHLYTVLLPLAFVAGLTFGYIFWGRADSSGESVPVVAAAPAADQGQGQVAPQEAEPTPEFRRYDVPEDDDPVLGPAQAPITIIEFSDYECPYCQKWHLEVWPALQSEYGDQIRLVYRDFPLTSLHNNAIPAAAAANCAREQDMYWEYNELLFDMKFNLGKSTYNRYAEELGLDMDAFTECVDSGRHVAEVEADYEYAVNLGIRSTPTFFVNGIPVVGAQPFETFKNLIDKELAGELPQ
jgi:protein-disulfide isomerase